MTVWVWEDVCLGGDAHAHAPRRSAPKGRPESAESVYTHQRTHPIRTYIRIYIHPPARPIETANGADTCDDT